MIFIETDEAYAMDYLSILEVKLDKTGLYKNRIAYESCKSFLFNQIGGEKFDQVMDSEEYNNLYEANWRVWDLVDAAKNDLVKASEVDAANYERWKFKNELQKKFFGGNYSEVKVGYEKIES